MSRRETDTDRCSRVSPVSGAEGDRTLNLSIAKAGAFGQRADTRGYGQALNEWVSCGLSNPDLAILRQHPVCLRSGTREPHDAADASRLRPRGLESGTGEERGQGELPSPVGRCPFADLPGFCQWSQTFVPGPPERRWWVCMACGACRKTSPRNNKPPL